MKRLLLLLLLSLTALTAQAEERILDFNSDITVFGDGTMGVTETIKVRAEGQQIKRGIYRDFPTDYHDANGNRYRVTFDIVSVKRDGYEEDFHTERLDNGVRVYIGSADHFLAVGEYTYTLSYLTSRQLGFFAEHDELYWNVTGNGWKFPIDHASARVHLPTDIQSHQITTEAYTGATGDKGRNYLDETLSDGAYFETTEPLSAQQGLTIVVGWPKGIVHEPTRQERLVWLLKDNTDLAIGLAGLLLLFCFYLLVWVRVGRDPKPGVIIPQYEAPAGLSPGAVRFITQMGHDDKNFTAALVSLAVKGYVKLLQDDDDYTAQRTDKPAGNDLGPGEQALLKALFSDMKKSVAFKQKHHKRIKEAINANRSALLNNYDKIYFLSNSSWLTPGILITLVTVVAAVLFNPDGDVFVAVFMSVWLSGWSVGVFFLLRMAYNAWRYSDGIMGYGSAIASSLFALPFLVGELFGLGVLISATSFSVVIVLAALIAVNALFYQLLKAPTRAGRAVLDKLEGLKLYLEVAEKDELQFKHPPEKTPELFERLFPYAMALDVEQRWAERFTAVFANLESEQQTYSPGWYHGSHFNSHAIGDFAGSLGDSMSSVISSSSTAPGSSSGSSSGGFSSSGGSSGGGGGGGGGGGW